ncbi:tRNA (adenosine(37)-N6)-threonylcarbamoyltransferase complex dimerization subunit type 1 TsaB [Mesorhizobium retamae]|uniref:N(6)-L-threonylcarbamoyladenine synthase n=1 Tax=Mesorhizobium retamae TaxID=2912854 RepID=A0ABS9QDL0_9HYPH|nr:tRNA (adenosine(37)-N6)-threonylcarbamoyltransferase complex dimerization subunit type 1 TsaB [Mesorhizobium sp. IRAMC:0171]MCG7505516.1 tRNA (adenosine(37)-N6)-threonylcarbamoyltransferase complex dimerization subunit type 1 TsaB [Mesorhizobium sp. IRAMC:0171]
MKLLAVDCSASLCAACVYDTATDQLVGRHVLDLGKGHAEHLMAVIDTALAGAGVTYADLGAIAVSTGPGSFTGIRVGVSAARGLALALKVPAIGVTTLEALAAEAAKSFPDRAVLAVLDGGRGEIHAALFGADGAVLHGPAIATLEEASGMARNNAAVLVGTAAETVAAAAGGGFDLGPFAATADIATYARLAALKEPGEKPRPVYLRDADAKPQAGFVLPRAG